MPEKLSQKQIDALFKRIDTGEVAYESDENAKGKKIKEYDFKSPKKFTKEQLKALDSLHENFSRVLSSYFSGLLRVFCEVSVLQIEEQRYFEYNNALPDSALVGLLDLRPEDSRYNEATLIMDMSTSIGYFMIDRLLGGSGDGNNLSREYTDIEIAILENIFQKIAQHLQVAWCNYIEVKTSLNSIETNTRLLQALAPEDIVIIAVLNMKIKNLTGNLNICIPAVNLEEMINSFSVRYTRSAKRQSTENENMKRQIILNALTDSDLEIKAVLDEFQLDLKDILQLQVADVIPLNKKISSDVFITVDDTPWFHAKLGETKLKKAIKLNNLIS
ncbi:flagellar motor switch protein FliM [Oscillospiraceae bacterium PP1C4]